MSSTDKLNLNFQNQTRSAIDAAMVNAVVMATLKVCRVMGDVEVLFKRLVAQKDYSPCGDISALIGIAGDTGEGVVAISLSLKAANLLVGRLLRVDPRSVDSYDRKDGVGELVKDAVSDDGGPRRSPPAAPQPTRRPTVPRSTPPAGGQ